MQSSALIELVGKLTSVDVATADVECCTWVPSDLSRLIAWAEATKITVAQRLAALAAASPEIFPEHLVATTTRVSLGQALQPANRRGVDLHTAKG